MRTPKAKISIGDKFGKWTVIDLASRDKSGAKCYKCECVCGYKLSIAASSLQNGRRSRCANCFHADRTESVKKREIGKIYNNWQITNLIKVNYKLRTKLTVIIKHVCGLERSFTDFYMLEILPPRCKNCVPLKKDTLRRYKSREKIKSAKQP